MQAPPSHLLSHMIGITKNYTVRCHIAPATAAVTRGATPTRIARPRGDAKPRAVRDVCGRQIRVACRLGAEPAGRATACNAPQVWRHVALRCRPERAGTL